MLSFSTVIIWSFLLLLMLVFTPYMLRLCCGVHKQNWSFFLVNKLWPLCNVSFYPCTYTLSELYVSNIDNPIDPILINIFMIYLFLHAMVWMCLLKIFMLKSNCQYDSIRRQRHWKDIRSWGLCFHEISAQKMPKDYLLAHFHCVKTQQEGYENRSLDLALSSFQNSEK